MGRVSEAAAAETFTDVAASHADDARSASPLPIRQYERRWRGRTGSWVTLRAGDELAEVRLVGEHDCATESDIREALAEGLALSANMVVDLAGTQFIDATVLAALVAAQLVALRAGKRVSLIVNPRYNVSVRRTLALTGLTGAFETFDTRADALRSLRTA